MKLPYSEGTWFAVPLGKGEYCIGVVARAAPRGCVMLCYFFGPRRCSLPSLSEVEDLRAGDAVLVARVGDLALVQGDWPVLGQPKIWRRQDWPMPFFIRRAEFSARAWKVHYSDHDPAE